jgi:hypothetical protein
VSEVDILHRVFACVSFACTILLDEFETTEVAALHMGESRALLGVFVSTPASLLIGGEVAEVEGKDGI